MAWGWKDCYGTFVRCVFILSSSCGTPWVLYFIRYPGKTKLFKMRRTGSSFRCIYHKLKQPVRFAIVCQSAAQQINTDWWGLFFLFFGCLPLLPPPSSPHPIFLSSLYSLCNLQEYFLWRIPPGGSQGPECENSLVYLPTRRTWDRLEHYGKLDCVTTARIPPETR